MTGFLDIPLELREQIYRYASFLKKYELYCARHDKWVNNRKEKNKEHAFYAERLHMAVPSENPFFVPFKLTLTELDTAKCFGNYYKKQKIGLLVLIRQFSFY